jgi:translation initiation factor 2 alpha subunit (eIF-2alpha)
VAKEWKQIIKLIGVKVVREAINLASASREELVNTTNKENKMIITFYKEDFKSDEDFEYYLKQMGVDTDEYVTTIDLDFEKYYGDNKDLKYKKRS